MTYTSVVTRLLLSIGVFAGINSAIASQLGSSNLNNNTEQEFEVGGLTQNYTGVRKDGFVDFAMVVPAFSRSQVMRIQMSDLLSSELDEIDVPFNKLEVPSNTAFPDQKERYAFINVRFNKPQFRYQVSEPGEYHFSAIHGKFPFKTVVKEVQDGKSLFDVLNHFEFIEGGMRTVVVNGDMSGQDIAVNQTRFDRELAVKAPEFNAGLIQLSVALSQNEGLMVATDLKRLDANGSANLKTIGNSEPKFVASLLSQNVEAINWARPGQEIELLAQIPWVMNDINQSSLVLQTEADLERAPQYLEFIAPPVVTEEAILSQPPALAANMEPLATYIAFIEVEKIQTEQVDSEKTTVLWSDTIEGWVDSVSTPKLDFEQDPSKIYRWQVIYMGQDRAMKDNPKTIGMNAVTHATRNSTDI